MTLTYQVLLEKSEEGFAVRCPALPGCWSQGETEEEALANIRSAIAEYLEAIFKALPEGEMREVEVGVAG